jgi:hypothetical protein
MNENYKALFDLEDQLEIINYFTPLIKIMKDENITQYGLIGRQTKDGVDYGEGKTRKDGANLAQWNIWRDESLKSGWMLKFLNLISDRGVGRIRLMRLKPRTCYSLHQDLTPRIHVPIITNPECFMIINGEIKYLSYGKVWWTNTLDPHTALNTSDRDRYHLLVEVSN